MSRIFPLSPTLNQEITVGSKTFVWNGDRWKRSRVTATDVTSSDAATLTSAQSYADTQDAALSATITAAYEAYVDGQTADSATVTYVDDGDVTTLLDAQTYADAGDTTTLVAANAYTDTAVSNLIDGAPDALNTLDEIAAALNDDSNLYNTLTNYVDTQVASAEPTFTNNFMLMGA